jgi:hypothetical protein
MVAENEKQFMTYNILAFRDLNVFFGMYEKFFYSRQDELLDLFHYFPESLKIFLDKQEWVSKISEIKNNTSGLSSFRKRFFEWFNMFKVVKYLNFSHKSTFEKIPVTVAAEELLIYKKIDPEVIEAMGVLQYYRNMERFSLTNQC